MLDTSSIRENIDNNYKYEFVIGLLILNALYWQQYDEDTQASLKDNYATPLALADYKLCTLYGTDYESIPHFQDLSNVQRLSLWYDMYISDIKSHRELKKQYSANCVTESSKFSLVAILMAAVENELKYGTSIQLKVDKFSRRIAIYGHEILTVALSGNFAINNVIRDFPLTFDEACSLIPLEYEIHSQSSAEFKKMSGGQAFHFEKPREQLIEELRVSRQKDAWVGLTLYEDERIQSSGWLTEREALRGENYYIFFYENVPSNHLVKEAVKDLLGKYGEEYLRAAYSVDTKQIERWGELFHDLGVVYYGFFGIMDCNDINSNLQVVTELVGDLNRRLEEEFNQENDNTGDPYEDYEKEKYDPTPVDYFLIKDYVAAMPPRDIAMPRLVQLVLYRLYAGESFKLEDVDKLSSITAPLQSANSVQPALINAAYRCGVMLARLQLAPCKYGKAVIDELFPNLDTYFQHGISAVKSGTDSDDTIMDVDFFKPRQVVIESIPLFKWNNTVWNGDVVLLEFCANDTPDLKEYYLVKVYNKALGLVAKNNNLLPLYAQTYAYLITTEDFVIATLISIDEEIISKLEIKSNKYSRPKWEMDLINLARNLGINTESQCVKLQTVKFWDYTFIYSSPTETLYLMSSRGRRGRLYQARKENPAIYVNLNLEDLTVLYKQQRINYHQKANDLEYLHFFKDATKSEFSEKCLETLKQYQCSILMQNSDFWEKRSQLKKIKCQPSLLREWLKRNDIDEDEAFTKKQLNEHLYEFVNFIYWVVVSSEHKSVEEYDNEDIRKYQYRDCFNQETIEDDYDYSDYEWRMRREDEFEEEYGWMEDGEYQLMRHQEGLEKTPDFDYSEEEEADKNQQLLEIPCIIVSYSDDNVTNNEVYQLWKQYAHEAGLNSEEHIKIVLDNMEGYHPNIQKILVSPYLLQATAKNNNVKPLEKNIGEDF